MAAGAVQQIEREPALLSGIFTAFREGDLVGAVWSQRQPGRIVMLTGPAATNSAPAATLPSLLVAAEGYAATCDAVLVQCLLTDADVLLEEGLLERDYQPVAELAYLVSLAERFPTSRPDLPCEFETYRESHSNRDRLAALLEATYIQTLDCPSLNGVRDSRDVIDGYQAGGLFSPERWFFLRQQDRDVGCLLLTDYPDHDQWELIYLGLVPEVRGRGWGLDITRYAQWLARQAGRSRLVLAVDESNAPALRAYASAGFVAWNRRRVLCKQLTTC